jgi:hypothetical protein
MSSGPTLYVDIDSTLVYPFESEKAASTQLDHEDTIFIEGIPYRILRKNVYIVQRIAASPGVHIVFWSQGGALWAKTVCEALMVDHLSNFYLTKPSWYLDDREDAGFFGTNTWIDARKDWPE